MTIVRTPMARLQISIERETPARLRTVARARGTSIAGVIRDAVDAVFPADREARAAALTRLQADEFIAERRTDAVPSRERNVF
jgi:hypothetical protein